MTDKKPVPAFVIDPAPTIEWPVIVSIPVDGGGNAEFQFTGIFKRLSDAELDEVLGVDEAGNKALPEIKPGDGSGELIAGEPFVPAPRMRDMLRENADLFPKLLIGWKGVTTATGEEAAFSDESLRAQTVGANGRFLSAGLWRAITEIRNGARLGN